MQNPILKLKKEQKARAKEIRELKNKRPLKNRGDEKLWHIQMVLNSMSYQFRHYHIAYCEFRGRKREEIEQKVREDNKPNEAFVDRVKDQLHKDMEEYHAQKNVCLDAA